MPLPRFAPAVGALLFAALPAKAMDLVERFVRDPKADAVALSPDGAHLAVRVPSPGKTVLVVMRRDSRDVVAHMSLGDDTHVGAFTWVSPTVLVAGLDRRAGSREAPSPTGLVYRLSLDDREPRVIAGPITSSVADKTARVDASYLIDGLRGDDANILLAMVPIDDTTPMVEVMRVSVAGSNGRRVARAPVARASFIVDPQGRVRAAVGSGTDNQTQLHHRADDGARWTLVNDTAASGEAWWPLGFSADGTALLVQRTQPSGPDRLDWWTPDDGLREAWRDPVFDPGEVLVDEDTGAIYAVESAGGRHDISYLDEGSPTAKVHRRLARALPGLRLRIGASSGGFRLVQASNDTTPGDVYLFDEARGALDGLMSFAEWIDPAAMAEKTPIHFAARDGTRIDGYITRPRNAPPGPLPLVLLPHGGPLGVRDDADFDADAQLLAAAGYGVLQINFRGSSGRGDAFVRAGRGEWGGRMIDDLFDGLDWAIDAGHAEKGSVCAVGASYGAFAAMLALARDPDMFACGAGVVGVYDLANWADDADVGRFRATRNAVRTSLGDKDLAAISPITQAGRIQDPVLLDAGAEDRRAPATQTEAFAAALRAAGVPVDAKVHPREGHGFVRLEARRDQARRLLGFLAEHLPVATR